MNDSIRVREVRVVDTDGQQIGVLPIKEALRLAREKGLDLVEVAPSAKPPVCRIMDFGRFRYEQSKREREAKKKQRIVEIKEIRMTPKIDDHDYNVKAKAAERFLREGNKVKVSVRFRGREIVHTDIGKDLLADLAEAVKDVGTVERPPQVEGKNMIMILTPRQDHSAKATPTEKDEQDQS